MKLKHFVIMVIAAGCIRVYPVQAAPPISATSAEPSYQRYVHGEMIPGALPIFPYSKQRTT